MAQVLAASLDMFDEIMSVLDGFSNPNISKAQWRTLVSGPFPHAEGEPPGYVLYDKGHVQGFIGTIRSRRIIQGKEERFCNITSWIVKPEYRAGAGFIFSKALEPKDCTMTALSSATHHLPWYVAKGFKPLEPDATVISPLTALVQASTRFGVRFLHNVDDIRSILDPGDQLILKDHLPYTCQHLAIVGKEAYCYVIYNIRSNDRYAYASVYYLSSPELFARTAGHIALELFWRLKCQRLSWDTRYLRGLTVPLGKKVAFNIPRLYRSSHLVPEEVPNIYCELPVLGS